MAGSTPIYGFPYPEPSDLVANYPALGQDLAEDIEAVLPTIGGLAPSAPTTIANSGGSASLSGNTVTFTGVSSISLNNCFSTTYDNYRFALSAEPSAATATLNARMRVSGADNTSANYLTQGTFVNESTTNVYRINNGTGFLFGDAASTYENTIVADIQNPFRAEHTTLAWTCVGSSGTTYQSHYGGMRMTSNTSFTSITFYTNTGTFTGTVSVYGYRK